MKQSEALKFLAERGAVRDTRTDHNFGTKRTGWWLDNVFCGPDARSAVAAIRG